MPFADEILPGGVKLTPYQASWAADFRGYRDELEDILGSLALAVEHIGSTSVPGMASKDCIDIQVLVLTVSDPVIEHRMAEAGFRKRPEPWNLTETAWGQETGKQVYAPAVGRRACNVHVRTAGSSGAKYARLFRDYLIANAAARDAWSEFKQRLARSVPDLSAYGTVKQPATRVLMDGALRWAEANRWGELEL